jgi:protein-arginine kinase activator protein McsA
MPRYTKESKFQMIKEFATNLGLESLETEFNTSNKSMRWRCLKDTCGREWKTSWTNFKILKGCSRCLGAREDTLTPKYVRSHTKEDSSYLIQSTNEVTFR